MRYAKRISIYILVGLLSVGSICGSYTQGVYAFEWVGGAIAFEEALKWLLGAIGICAGVGFTHDMWEQYGDDFTDYCIQHEIQQAEIAQWQGKLSQGVLDKASECWSAFLDWASSFTSDGSSSGSTSGVNASNVLSAVLVQSGFKNSQGLVPSVNLTNDFTVYGAYIYYQDANHFYVYLCSTNTNYIFSPSSYFLLGTSDITAPLNNRVPFTVYTLPSNIYSKTVLTDSDLTSRTYSAGFTVSGNSNNWSKGYYYNLNFYDNNQAISNPGLNILTGVAPIESPFESLSNLDTSVLDIISSDIPDEDASEVAIPMPGVSTSDDSASASAYDDIVDAINDGTITLDDGITRIQELLRVIVYDDTTDDVIPIVNDPDSGEPVKKDDVIQDNKNNMGFTLAGLENVFPFCIPWDLYAFINILRADPVAPVFILPFPNPFDLEHPYQIRVDLSSWNDAMAIFRLAEDFLFIIGLAILTRSLIGAGGGDG